MLTPIQQQAIAHCLTGIDLHAHGRYPWPGPVLLAALREVPVAGHPDPTARYLGVVPVPVPPTAWQHPDGLLRALRQVAADLHRPTIQAALALADETDVRVLAWAFMHPTHVEDIVSPPAQARVIEAVDIDDTVHVLTHLPDEPHGLVTMYEADDAGTPEAVAVLHALSRALRTR